MSSFSPGLVLILGAILIPFLEGRLRQLYLLLLPLLSFVLLNHLELGAHPGLKLFGYDLILVHVDELSFMFGALFHLALFVGTIYALHVKDWVQHVSAFVYAGSTIGAVLAGDLITLFIFWEIVAVSSVFLIWARRTPRAYSAGMRYLIFQIVSGVLLLAGILLLGQGGTSLLVGDIGLPPLDRLSDLPDAFASDPGAFCIFLGIGIKCAFPGLHTWLTDAYPEATPTGAVFLSSFTTKLAVYALIRCFAGTDVLIGIGVIMTLFPIFYAVIENDLRRVLAYSMVNQVGFMVIGVGVGTELAIRGAASHAFADVLFKGLLFMSMGAVLHRTGTAKASELGGLHKTMPWTMAFCLVGAASISAFPLFSAFATKSMIVDAVAGEQMTLVWFAMIFASAGVLHHAGIKIPYCAFFAHDSGKRPKEAPWNMRVAMGIAAILCVAIGCYPAALYELLPPGPDYHPYKLAHIVTQGQLLCFAVLAFVVLTRNGFHPDEIPSTNLDADWVWRRLCGRILVRVVYDPLALIARAFEYTVLTLIPNALTDLVTDRPESGPLRSQMILGSSVILVMGFLALLLWIGHAS